MVSGADSQCAETIRIAVGRGRSADHAASWLVQSLSSTRGGAPCPMYRAGIFVMPHTVLPIYLRTQILWPYFRPPPRRPAWCRFPILGGRTRPAAAGGLLGIGNRHHLR